MRESLDTIVLIVDDERAIASSLQKVLMRQGFVVLVAENAELALEIIDSPSAPQVVLTDKNLPGMSGIELLAKGKALAPDLEFIIMTGHPSIDSAVSAIELGASGFLQKPFDVDVMIKQVRAALSKHLALVENRKLGVQLQGANDRAQALAAERDVYKGFVQERLVSLLKGIQADCTVASAAMPASEPAALAKLAHALTSIEEFLGAHGGLTVGSGKE